ncbi:hypothetical protein [Natronosalvus halobius]|uniref:hypothetical protein n=1 Tax=Natronosalvus halobius TaxID=2953746 RepID=UPI00209DDD14|nr:hypothetical protein [Natronosalvus halobius]USZ73759.1 hypothetical protein NGM15_18655 [Natronosalvus halobius]
MGIHYTAVCCDCRFRESGSEKADAQGHLEDHRSDHPTHNVVVKEAPVGGAAEYPDRRP